MYYNTTSGKEVIKRLMASSRIMPDERRSQVVSVPILGYKDITFAIYVQYHADAATATLAIVLAAGITASLLLAGVTVMLVTERWGALLAYLIPGYLLSVMVVSWRHWNITALFIYFAPLTDRFTYHMHRTAC